MDFESANPSVVRSVRQRELLNSWLRLYARQQTLPRLTEYQPERMKDELPDLVFYLVDTSRQPARFIIDSHSTRISTAYGANGKGRDLDDYLGPIMATVVVPVYQECLRRALPTYTVSMIDDVHGRAVAYERVLMPFSDGDGVNHIIASLKAISEHGGFEIRDLMRGPHRVLVPKIHAVIDRDLFHRAPARTRAGDIVEFE